MNARLGASVAVVGLFLYVGPAHVASGLVAEVHRVAHSIHGAAGHGGTATLTSAHGGTFSCSGLERLWESAGGSRSEAFTAAEVAMAESSGESGAMNYTDNGGTQTSVGIWQLSTGTHDYPAAWKSPAGNAAGAVAKYAGAGDSFTPWGTYDTGIYAGRC